MQNLLGELKSDESLLQFGKLVAAKLKQYQNLKERLEVASKVFSALYEPLEPQNIALDRLISYVKDSFEELDENTARILSVKIQQVCVDAKSQDDSLKGALIELKAKENVANLVKEPPLISNQVQRHESKWYSSNRLLHKNVKIKIGMYYGSIGCIQEVMYNKAMVKLVDGKIVKYMLNNLEVVSGRNLKTA